MGMESKKWYKSKTYQWGGALAALGLAILNLPEFQAFIAALPPEYIGYATLIVAVVTAALRTVTDKPVTWR